MKGGGVESEIVAQTNQASTSPRSSSSRLKPKKRERLLLAPDLSGVGLAQLKDDDDPSPAPEYHLTVSRHDLERSLERDHYQDRNWYSGTIWGADATQKAGELLPPFGHWLSDPDVQTYIRWMRYASPLRKEYSRKYVEKLRRNREASEFTRSLERAFPPSDSASDPTPLLEVSEPESLM